MSDNICECCIAKFQVIDDQGRTYINDGTIIDSLEHMKENGEIVDFRVDNIGIYVKQTIPDDIKDDFFKGFSCNIFDDKL